MDCRLLKAASGVNRPMAYVFYVIAKFGVLVRNTINAFLLCVVAVFL
jgi:hypothetical protein